jgi:hypothetical protein
VIPRPPRTAHTRRPWKHVETGGPPVPTMITVEEKKYLVWLTQDFWSGTGDVVEVGPWLGGSTWCLASGMRFNGSREPAGRLHVIDNFRWLPFMSERADVELKPGQSFRPNFERNLAPYLDIVVVHEVSLPDDDSAALAEHGGIRAEDGVGETFSADIITAQVAIAFVDGAKSWQALRHLLHELAPRFVPDKSVIVFQDFQAALAFWVPMAVALLLRGAPNSLEVLHVLRYNTVTFRVTGPIDRLIVSDFPVTVDDIALQEGVALLAEIERLLQDLGHRRAASTVNLSKVAFLGTRGAWEEARWLFEAIERDWSWRSGSINQLAAIRRWLIEHAAPDLRTPPRVRRVEWCERRALGVVRRLGLVP